MVDVVAMVVMMVMVLVVVVVVVVAVVVAAVGLVLLDAVAGANSAAAVHSSAVLTVPPANPGWGCQPWMGGAKHVLAALGVCWQLCLFVSYVRVRARSCAHVSMYEHKRESARMRLAV